MRYNTLPSLSSTTLPGSIVPIPSQSLLPKCRAYLIHFRDVIPVRMDPAHTKSFLTMVAGRPLSVPNRHPLVRACLRRLASSNPRQRTGGHQFDNAHHDVIGRHGPRSGHCHLQRGSDGLGHRCRQRHGMVMATLDWPSFSMPSHHWRRV